MDVTLTLLWAVPLLATTFLMLTVCRIFRRDKSKQKLAYLISLAFTMVGNIHLMLRAAGITSFLEVSYYWGFLPITFLVFEVAFSSLKRLKSFDNPFKYFLVVAGLSAVMLLVPFSIEAAFFPLLYMLATLTFTILLWLFLKRRDLIDFLFLMGLVCNMLAGISMALWSETITIIFVFFSIAFYGQVFLIGEFYSGESALASIMILKSQLRKTRRELRIVQEKLLRAERLAAIGELAGMVGHDLRNPLTGIALAAYYLKAKTYPRLNEKEKEMLEVILRDIKRADKIINDLLEYSREIVLDKRPANLNQFLREILLSINIPEKIQTITLIDELPNVMVDAEKIRRAFINIIQNAVDAMPEGGTLTIKGEKFGGKILISFKDTGIGIPPENLEKIWTPLFTTKAKGMGFGLAICKRIIEAHEGKITVESSPGKGTTFTVILPLKPKSQRKQTFKIDIIEPSKETIPLQGDF